MWPAVGYISTFFGEKGIPGIDIAGPLGTPIYAADAGVVTLAGWNGGYGYCVIIDHGNGWETVYGHFSSYYPQAGQNVRRGQAIARWARPATRPARTCTSRCTTTACW